MLAESKLEIRTETVNIDEMEAFHDVKLGRRLAAIAAEDNLAEVNAHSAPVTPRRSFYTRWGKRTLDIGISGLALLVTAPINLALGVGTFLDVGRPIFFRQQRTGLDGKPFTIVKFRNMTNAVDAEGNLLPANERVTKLGKFVRRTSLDELLNFWSIFKGDMSLIGPRPLSPVYDCRYSRRHAMRSAVRPGLECPILNCPDHDPTWVDQFENDVYYVEHLSLGLDLRMILALVGMVLNKESTTVRGAATRGSFMGYYPDGTVINSHSVPAAYVERVLAEEEERVKREVVIAR